MLEPSKQLNGQVDESTPVQTRSTEQTPQIESNSNESNLLLLTANDSKFDTCQQWIKSTMEHRQFEHDDQSSSKQSTNDDDDEEDDDDLDSDRLGTTTDTDNDNDLFQSSSTTRPTYPVNIISSDQHVEDKSHSNSSQHLLSTSNQMNNNDLNIYSTSVASGASIETLKASNNLSSPLSSPSKQTDASRSKPTSWADLFRSNQSSLPLPSTTTTTTSPTKKSQSVSASSTSSLARSLSGTQISPASQHNGNNLTQKSTNNHFHPRTNYQVYNSNGGESKSLEG